MVKFTENIAYQHLKKEARSKKATLTDEQMEVFPSYFWNFLLKNKLAQSELLTYCFSNGIFESKDIEKVTSFEFKITRMSQMMTSLDLNEE